LNSNLTQTESENVISMLRLEAGSIGQMTGALANSAMQLLFSSKFSIEKIN
jgi:hypothetical protein